MMNKLMFCGVVFAAACGGKSGGGASEPVPGMAKVEVNKDKSRTTPITSGEHESTAKTAQALGCEVKTTADQHIDTMSCTFDGATYKFIFESSGDQSNQKIWCETAEASAANCDAMAFDKILDPKPAATAPEPAAPPA